MFKFQSLKMRGIITLLICVWSVFCCAQDTCTLKVEVTGIVKYQGTLYAVLFDKAGFMEKKLQAKSIKVEGGKEPFVLNFEGLKKGSYAVVLFLDENENGKTDRNELGMPTELIGFSNDAPCSYGPPSFSDAEIKLDGNKTIKVEMYYFSL